MAASGASVAEPKPPDRDRKRLKRAARRPADIDDEARHEVRIVAKKLRCAAEFRAGPAARRRCHTIDPAS